jgi:hypothetical protein
MALLLCLSAKGSQIAGECLESGASTRRFLVELQSIERCVASAAAQQLLVATLFDDSAVFDKENAVGVHDRLQPMGDHHGGALAAEAGNCILDVTLGFAVECCRRLIEEN